MSKVGDVRFTFALPIYSSGRRLAKEGIFSTGVSYIINYFWITIFKRPFTMTATEVRIRDEKLPDRPESSAKEWLIALAAIVVIFIVIEGLIYAFSRFRL